MDSTLRQTARTTTTLHQRAVFVRGWLWLFKREHRNDTSELHYATGIGLPMPAFQAAGDSTGIAAACYTSLDNSTPDYGG
jgi:hypothetical protein